MNVNNAPSAVTTEEKKKPKAGADGVFVFHRLDIHRPGYYEVVPRLWTEQHGLPGGTVTWLEPGPRPPAHPTLDQTPRLTAAASIAGRRAGDRCCRLTQTLHLPLIKFFCSVFFPNVISRATQGGKHTVFQGGGGGCTVVLCFVLLLVPSSARVILSPTTYGR